MDVSPDEARPLIENLFTNIPNMLTEELFETLAQNDHVRIERIVSEGHTTPKDFWYDQDEHEWVVLLKGEAKLLFDGDDEVVHMKPGDHIHISAGQRHRVQWSTPDEPTVWLAVFYET